MDPNKLFKKAFNYQLKENYKKAEDSYKKLLKLNPEKSAKATILYNLGLVLMSLDNYKEACICFDDSNKLSYNNQNTWNKSLSLLNMGKWEEGMYFYKSRYADDNQNNITSVSFPKLPIPFIDDANESKDKDLLVLNEQGLGDQLLFGTQIPRLSKIVKSATIQVSEDTIDLFKDIYNFDNINYVIFESISIEDVEKHDMYIGLGDVFASLYKFGESFLKEEYYSSPGTNKVGVCWSANKNSPSGKKRSVDPKLFKDINFELVSLQYGGGQEIGIPNYTPKNIYETWKRMDGLDVVVTVDTLMAHIAGLKGIPTLLVIKQLDWRWKFRDKEDNNYSMFYPMVEIVSINDDFNAILSEILT